MGKSAGQVHNGLSEQAQSETIEVRKTLQQAAAAASQCDWNSVNLCLQKLPLADKSVITASERVEEALKLALQVLEAGDFQQRWDAAKILTQLGQVAIAPLLEIIEDEQADPEVCWYTVRILSQCDCPAVIIALVQLLQKTEDEELATMAAQALAQIGPSAVTALNSLLIEESSRLLAVQALSYLRCQETIEPLLTIVDDPSHQVRVTALEALGSFHDPRIVPILLNALQDPAAAPRKEAVIALGMRSKLQTDLDLVKALKPLLYDLNVEVCRQAAIALGRAGSDEAAEALSSVLISSDTPVPLKLNVVRALGWIETTAALTYLQAGLYGEQAVCQEVVAVLGRIELPALKEQATQILLNFLRSESVSAQLPHVQQALVMSLGELGQTEAIAPLQKLAINSDQGVKFHIEAALRKISDLLI